MLPPYVIGCTARDSQVVGGLNRYERGFWLSLSVVHMLQTFCWCCCVCSLLFVGVVCVLCCLLVLCVFFVVCWCCVCSLLFVGVVCVLCCLLVLCVFFVPAEQFSSQLRFP